MLGVSFDGTGYGDDGAIWGGEIFAGSVARGFRAVAHLRYASLPGGDAAAQHPVQAAAGFPGADRRPSDLTAAPFHFPARYRSLAASWLRSGVRTFPTTSIGRLFDAAAALLGFTRAITFEGQAAMWLEQIARAAPARDAYPFPFAGDELDFRPLLLAVAEDRRRGRDPCGDRARLSTRRRAGICATRSKRSARANESARSCCPAESSRTNCCSTTFDPSRRARASDIWTNHAVPPNDGGISLGQAALAALGPLRSTLMHELSIAMSIVEAAEEEAERHHGCRVAGGPSEARAALRRGEGSAAVLLRAGRGGYAAARLATGHRGKVADRGFCPVCKERRPIRSLQSFCCAACGTPAAEVVQGRELEVVGLEMSQESTPESEPRLVEVRQKGSQAERRAGARAAAALSRRRRLRRQPGLEPRLRQDGVPRKDADRAAAGSYRVAALVGDLATDNDAARLARSGAPVKQIITGTVCHLEAEMVASASKDWDLDELDFLFIENVGNLVCPSSYDLGEDLRLVLLSVTEGEDKPLKYPTIFNSADVAVITKIDLAAAVEFDSEAANANIQAVRPGMQVLSVSAKSGAGMDEFAQFLLSKNFSTGR